MAMQILIGMQKLIHQMHINIKWVPKKMAWLLEIILSTKPIAKNDLICEYLRKYNLPKSAHYSSYSS